MIAPNPFTPQSGWEPKVFGGRFNEIEVFKKCLQEATSGRSNHIVVLGEWGIGKTALLKHYRNLAQGDGYPSALCPIGSFTKNDRIVDGIHLIIEEIIHELPIKGLKKVLGSVEGAGVTIAGTGGHLVRKPPSTQPQILFTDKLLDIWKSLNTKLAVILLDDIQSFEPISQTLDIIRLVLSRDLIIRNTKYLFVLSSTPEGWQNFIDKHNPISRFFRIKQTLTRLNAAEVSNIVKKTLENTGVEFSSDVVREIYTYTNGHPYELQVFCSNLYDLQITGLVGKEQLEKGLENTLRDLGRDYFDILYRQITDREAPIIKALAQNGSYLEIKDIKDILASDKKGYPNYPIQDIKNYVYRLVEKGILKKTTRGKYEIFDKMFQEYFLRKHET